MNEHALTGTQMTLIVFILSFLAWLITGAVDVPEDLKAGIDCVFWSSGRDIGHYCVRAMVAEALEHSTASLFEHRRII